MSFDPELAAMLFEPWSNGACRGHVMAELYELFDFKTLEEAETHYQKSPY